MKKISSLAVACLFIAVLSAGTHAQQAPKTAEIPAIYAEFASGYVKPNDSMFSGVLKNINDGGNRGFFAFDLSSFPLNANITNVSLKFYVKDVSIGLLTEFGTITSLPNNPVNGKVTYAEIGSGTIYSDKVPYDNGNPKAAAFNDVGIAAVKNKIGATFFCGLNPAKKGLSTARYNTIEGFDSTDPLKKPILVVTYEDAPAPSPTADFSASVRDTVLGVEISFFDNSSAQPTSWKWDLGDGATSTQQNPSHTYADTGVYTVSLIATNAQGSDTSTKENYIHIKVKPPAPIAEFEASETTVYLGDSVYFFDRSEGNPVRWNWDFGDGETAVIKNPKHLYMVAGRYNVTLIATSPYGADTIEKNNYINVVDPFAAPKADFGFSGSQETVNFTDLSLNSPTSWFWDFGDGSSSTEQNPSHTYATLGNYSVCLNVLNETGEDSTCKNVTIPVVGIQEEEGLSFKVYPMPTNNYFTVEWKNNRSPFNSGTLFIYDSNGRVKSKYNLDAGYSRVTIDLQNFDKGVYFIKLVLANDTHSQYILLE